MGHGALGKSAHTSCQLALFTGRVSFCLVGEVGHWGGARDIPSLQGAWVFHMATVVSECLVLDKF